MAMDIEGHTFSDGTLIKNCLEPFSITPQPQRFRCKLKVMFEFSGFRSWITTALRVFCQEKWSSNHSLPVPKPCFNAIHRLSWVYPRCISSISNFEHNFPFLKQIRCHFFQVNSTYFFPGELHIFPHRRVTARADCFGQKLDGGAEGPSAGAGVQHLQKHRRTCQSCIDGLLNQCWKPLLP